MSTLVSVNGAQREAGLYAGVDGAVRILAGGGECFDWIVTGKLELERRQENVIPTPGMANFAFFTGLLVDLYDQGTYLQMKNTPLPKKIRYMFEGGNDDFADITYTETGVVIDNGSYNPTIIYFIGHKRE